MCSSCPAIPSSSVTRSEPPRLAAFRARAWSTSTRRMACEAVELMFHTAGSAPARKGHKLQRYFNDVAMYRGHSSSQFANFGAGLARLHFGLPWGMYGL